MSSKIARSMFLNVINRALICSSARFSHMIKVKPVVVHNRPAFRCNRPFLSCHAYATSFSEKVDAPKLKQRNYFVERENLLAHEVMENNCSYADTVVPHPMKRIQNGNYNHKVSSHEVFEKFYMTTFHNFKQQRTLGNAEFTNLVISLVQKIPNATFNDIELLLFCLCLWPQCASSYVPNFKMLWNKLDSECARRLKNWSVAEKLLIADYWFHLHLSRISIYNTSVIRDLMSNYNQLTNSQFVHLMFCANLQRNVPPYLFDNLVKKLETIVNAVSLEELSIICLGFFKTESKINNNNILKVILQRTTSNIDTLDTTLVIRVLKFLRKSFQPHMTLYYIPLLKRCIMNIERWELLTAVHVSLLSTKSYIFEPSLLDVIVEKMKNNITNSRLKDICKVVQCLSQFNYMPHSQFHEILFEEIMREERLDEAKEFPRDLLHLLLFYAYMGQYPLKVIAHILSPDFVEHCQATCGDHILTELAIIDYCTELECDGYSGPRLTPHSLNILKNNRSTSPTEYNKRDNSILAELPKNVMESLSRLITPDKYALRHVLPHMFNPDIIIRLSSKNSAPLQQIVDACPPENILRPPSDELWGCLIMCGPFSFPFKSKQLCGLLAMKQRQLKKLGYKTVLIPFQDFPAISNYREIYLKKKLEFLRLDED